MRKIWFNILMGMFVLLLASSCGVSYNVGGIVSELVDGETVVLQNNGGDNIEITANGEFIFSTMFLDGGTYNVTVLTQPNSQPCRVNNGSGTINGGDATDVVVICSALPVAIAAGGSHTIELKPDGTVWAWGSNQYGQLGDGTTTNSPAPIQVSGLTDITAIAAGKDHTIAHKADGTVWAWGKNEYGQLGAETIETCYAHLSCATTPIQVSGLTHVIAIAAGEANSIALKDDGTVWAWGSNQYGQLGAETIETCSYSVLCSSIPVNAAGLTEIIAIGIGGRHSVALKADGTVWTWGNNWLGQLGDGTNTDSLIPVQVSGLTDVAAIAVGRLHSVALKTDGTVWGWGDNSGGQLGDGTIGRNSTPVQVSYITNITNIAVGDRHTMALNIDGTVWAWGSNQYGQLGDGTNIDSTTPVQVSGLTDIIAIAGGMPHSIAVKNGDTLWAWGENSAVQLGAVSTDLCGYSSDVDCSLNAVLVRDSTTSTDYSVGGVVSGLGDGEVLILQNNGRDDITITANGPFTFAATLTDLEIYNITVLTQPLDQVCSVTSGRINAADVTDMQVTCSDILTNVTAIAAGGIHTVALRTDGTVWAWGGNGYGQLGNRTTVSNSMLVQVEGLTNVISVAAGDYHTIALKADGTVWGWGLNHYGQLGSGTTIASDTPIQVVGLTDVASIATRGHYTFAIKNDGTVWAWGYNSYGQLGDGTTTVSSTPVQISALTEVISITTGDRHTVALKTDGTVWAWGGNYYGQLGDGTTTESFIPVQVSGLTDIVAISAGDFHTLAIKTDGTAWIWGNNKLGLLESGEPIYSTTPEQLISLMDVTAIDGGGGIDGPFSVALEVDNTVWTWGENTLGQLGNGTAYRNTTPLQVSGLMDVAAIASGDRHIVALKIDGTVLAWGDNSAGQLGTETFEKCIEAYGCVPSYCSSIPVKVVVTP